MNICFINECAVDGCYKKHIIKNPFCRVHLKRIEEGETLTAWYGKRVRKTEKSYYKGEHRMSFAIHKKLGTIKEIPKHAEGYMNNEWVVYDHFPTKENYFEAIGRD